MRTFAPLLGAVILAASGSAFGQTPSPNQSPAPSVEARLERSARFLQMPTMLRDSLVTPRWAGADRIVYWDETGPDARSFVLLDGRTGRRKAVLPAEAFRDRLAALVGEPVGDLSNLQFAVAPDQAAILFRLGGRPIRMELADGAMTFAGGADAAVLDGANFAPAGGRAWTAEAGGFRVLSPLGAPLFERAGEPDYAWTVPQGAWSPDGAWLVATRTDRRAVHRIPIVDYDGGLERVTMAPYAKTGTPLPVEEFHLVEASSGRITPVSPGPEGYEWFAGWRPDGRAAFTLHLSRDGKALELFAVDLTGARRRLLREERPETNVGDLDFIAEDWATQVTPLGDGGFLWMSERDGWRHLYRYDRDGRLVNRVTRGDFPVRRVDAVRPDGVVLVSAALDPAQPYDQQLYRTRLEGGALQPVSAQPGFHRATASPSGRYIFDSWSSPEQPRVRDVVGVDDGVRHRLTTSDDAAVRAMGWRAPERITVLAADGTTPLYGAIFTPHDFDPSRRYPVVAYIYGGPFSTVLGGGYVNAMSLWANSLAQVGFVVVAIDVRGSAGRSKAFQDATYGRVGQTEIPDYVTGLRQLSASRPWMDMERIGIFGHSWGGYFAVRGMLTAPETFRAGYAGAPGALEEDASVNEPNMGLLADNPDGYAAASNMALAGNLVGHLKIMHGTSDMSASLSTTLRMADALVDADKRFELLLIPGMDHNSDGHDGLYYQRDVALFFLRTLGEAR